MPTSQRQTFRPDRCVVCNQPLARAKTGRPRTTCSDACRQKRRRRRTEQQREWARDDRRAERIVRGWERKFGSFDYPDDPDYPNLTLRWRLKFRLTRNIPVSFCMQCGKPFIPQIGNGKPLQHCSRACRDRDNKRERAVRESLAIQPERAHPLTEIHRRHGKCAACAHCGAAFPLVPITKRFCSAACRQADWRKRHPRRTCPGCGKRFYARPGKGGGKGAGGRPHVYCTHRCYREAWERAHPGRRKRRPTAEAAANLILEVPWHLRP